MKRLRVRDSCFITQPVVPVLKNSTTPERHFALQNRGLLSTRLRSLRQINVALLLAGLIRLSLATEYSPPVDPGPISTYGQSLQRSMRLMAQSPPGKKRTVRVLFYGQSITQEIWSSWVGDYLRQKYPNANLVITNLALTLNADGLIRAAVTDIPAFYPDLIIYHNYGPLADFEKIVALTRLRTTADIIVQTDHPLKAEDLTEVSDPAALNNPFSDTWRNYVALPAIASRYGAELALVRTYWKKYLLDNKREPSEFLRDERHPNLAGNYLLRDLLIPYLRVDLSFTDEPWRDAEKTYIVGSDLNWQGDELHLSFVGNRVDVIVESIGEAPISVRIDGRPPSQWPELYYFTRSDFYPQTDWLTVLMPAARTPLIEEEWTAKLLGFTLMSPVDLLDARFEVSGSKTGYDGEAHISLPFVSNSGRVTLEPLDWTTWYWIQSLTPAYGQLTPGDETHWRSRLLGRDSFIPQVPDATLESTITLAQGLANGPHLLTLTRTGPAPISAIRVFNPLARTHPVPVGKPEIAGFSRDGGKLWIQPGWVGRYVIENSHDLQHWSAISAPLTDRNVPVLTDSDLQFVRIRVVD